MQTFLVLSHSSVMFQYALPLDYPRIEAYWKLTPNGMICIQITR